MITRIALCASVCLLLTTPCFAEGETPELQAGVAPAMLVIDGALNEPAWAAAAAFDMFTQTEPREGAEATGRTVVRVLASRKVLVIGVVCDDPNPAGIVSFSVRRDASLSAEDHVRIVLGPFLDGRSGYVFAVNPCGESNTGERRDRKSTRLNSSHSAKSRMPSSA